MSFFLKGVRVPHRKNTAGQSAVRICGVRRVTIPMQMHIGSPAVPAVKVGDEVKIGSLIAKESGAFSAPIHASVSGRVVKISDILDSNGTVVPALTIESDGAMTPLETLSPPTVSSRDDLISAIREGGIVGLGGAGFPTHVKLDVDYSKIDEIIINGAECEPYVTVDALTMTQRADDIEYALNAFKKHFGIKRIIIGIENNKKDAIASMQALAGRVKGVEVKTLPSVYPQGGEKVLVYHTTKKVIPTGKLPKDVRCIVCNCTTVAAIGSYLKTGMPLVEKCVTVDGGAIREPQNVIVPIGTPIEDVFAFCGGFKSEPEKVIYGGPMMGVTVPNLDAPVLKNTNALIALTKKEARLPKTTACIRCGSCTNTCPFGLAPSAILRAYKKKDSEALTRLSTNACMECGCCSFVCPASLPLVQTNKLAKLLLKEEKEDEKNG